MLHESKSEVSPSLLRQAADQWENLQSENAALRQALEGRNRSIETLSHWLNETEEKLRQATDELYTLNSANADGRRITVPCKVGELVWGIRKLNTGRKVAQLPVHEMYFIEGMRLCIVLKGCCRGEWGKDVFGTREEAEAAMGGAQDG